MGDAAGREGSVGTVLGVLIGYDKCRWGGSVELLRRIKGRKGCCLYALYDVDQ